MSNLDDYKKEIEDFGLEFVMCSPFIGCIDGNTYEDYSYFYFGKGILLNFESVRGKEVDGKVAYYNSKLRDGATASFESFGFLKNGIWIGYLNGRVERFKKILETEDVLPEWKYHDRLNFTNYEERRTIIIPAEKMYAQAYHFIKRFPPTIQKKLGFL